MKFTVDTSKKYYDTICEHLRAYNRTYTGEKAKEQKYLYVLKDDILIGGMTIDLSWDWVTISHIKYDKLMTLKQMIYKLNDLYRYTAIGIRFASSFEEVTKDLIAAGFRRHADIKYSDLMVPVSYLEFKGMSGSCDRDILVMDTPDQVYQEVLDDHKRSLEDKYQVEKTTGDLFIVCHDNDDFLGGIHGVLYRDHMYISLLVVAEAARGKGIGSALMERIEDEIKDTSIQSISIGTTAFQAKDFYKKLGYQVIMTQYDLPKGFECYTLTKDL